MKKYADVIKTTEEWLKLTDQGKSDESWAAASQFFQSKISASDWHLKLSEVRTPLGVLNLRDTDTVQTYLPPPEVPDGEYVKVIFSTDFEKRSGVTESITQQKQDDGSWAVVGYFIS